MSHGQGSSLVAKALVKDMRAYFAEPNAITRDEIAARQLHALRGYQGLREKKLRVRDVKEMFERMKDQSSAADGG